MRKGQHTYYIKELHTLVTKLVQLNHTKLYSVDVMFSMDCNCMAAKAMITRENLGTDLRSLTAPA